jgi:hypothetical protein
LRKILVMILLILGFLIPNILPESHSQSIVPTGKKNKSITVPLDSGWVINPEGTDPMMPIVTPNYVGLDFPTSSTPDPYAQRPWLGYLIRPWTSRIRGSYLNMTFFIQTQGKRIVFNYKSEVSNTCDTPATVRLYFQTSTLYNGTDGTRWWSNPIAYTFHKVADGEVVTLSVPLDPQYWSSTFGHRGDYNDYTLTGFQNAIDNPTYIGMTFGGGCFFGHGINTSKGVATFQLTHFGTSS